MQGIRIQRFQLLWGLRTTKLCEAPKRIGTCGAPIKVVRSPQRDRDKIKIKMHEVHFNFIKCFQLRWIEVHFITLCILKGATEQESP